MNRIHLHGAVAAALSAAIAVAAPGAGRGAAITGGHLEPLVADQAVNEYRVPAPPRLLPAARAPRAATITIRYRQAADGGRLGDHAVNWPPQAQAALEYAKGIWEDCLDSPAPITIDACWADNMPEGVLGHSGALSYIRDFSGAIMPGTFYSAALANRLHGSDLDPAEYDMYMAFSSTFPWYFGTDGKAPRNTYDLATVVLHEICHGLGFLGSFWVNGMEGSWGLDSPAYPLVYDRMLENRAGDALMDTALFPNPSTALGRQLTSGKVQLDSPQVYVANDSARAGIFSPRYWRPGSSCVHLAEVFNRTPNALMTYSLGFGESVHSPGPVTMGLLNDLGWNPDALAVTGDYIELEMESTVRPRHPGYALKGVIGSIGWGHIVHYVHLGYTRLLVFWNTNDCQSAALTTNAAETRYTALSYLPEREMKLKATLRKSRKGVNVVVRNWYDLDPSAAKIYLWNGAAVKGGALDGVPPGHTAQPEAPARGGPMIERVTDARGLMN